MRGRTDTGMQTGLGACGLAAAAGRSESCPGVRCPLWEAHPNAPAAGCAIEPIVPHLKSRPELAHYLLELREQLGAALL